MRRTFGSIAAATSLLGAATWEAGGFGSQGPAFDPQPDFREIESPAGQGSGQPNLTASPQGEIYLSWIDTPRAEVSRLRFAIRSEGAWSEPRTVAQGREWFVNWADFPSLAVLSDGSLGAHWLVRSGSERFAYDVAVSRSPDGGTTWTSPVRPYRDETESEHGFVSLVPLQRGEMGIFWLDGREMVVQPGGSGYSGPGGSMALHYARMAPDGGIGPERVLDDRVCECCQTSAVMTSEGILLAYRGRSWREVRDIAVVRSRGEGWTEPYIPFADGWEIAGCPVNGPALAAKDRRVVLAWYTESGGLPRVLAAFSDDAGLSFRQPISIDDGNPLGRVHTALLPDGSGLVSWVEVGPGMARIRVRRVLHDGSRGPSVPVAETSSSRASGFPRLAVGRGEVLLAWTDPDASRVRAAAWTLP